MYHPSIIQRNSHHFFYMSKYYWLHIMYPVIISSPICYRVKHRGWRTLITIYHEMLKYNKNRSNRSRENPKFCVWVPLVQDLEYSFLARADILWPNKPWIWTKSIKPFRRYRRSCPYRQKDGIPKTNFSVSNPPKCWCQFFTTIKHSHVHCLYKKLKSDVMSILVGTEICTQIRKYRLKGRRTENIGKNMVQIS